MIARPNPRGALLATARAMMRMKLSTGTSGNVSVRIAAERFLITPSGLVAEVCGEEDMTMVDLDGETDGCRVPSSEWRLHRDIYARFAEAGAILHTHSPFATALACQRRDIPAFHYMIARFGGSDVRCAAYATFGTQALSDAAIAALENRKACLLANHGMLVWARDLTQVLAFAEEFETLCEQYWRTCLVGAPVLLTAAEMADVVERFSGYGEPPEKV